MSTALPAKAVPEAPPYRWVILPVATLLVALTAVTWHSFSVFLYTLSADFGWSRGDVSLAFFIFVVCSGVTGPNAGQLIDRFGASRVVFAGAIITAIGLAITSQMTNLWQFYIGYGIITAIGFAASGWVPTVTVIQTWFRGRLGAAMGVVSAGAGLGIFALVPAVQFSISQVGWRSTYLIMAVVSLVLIIPIALFLRTGPLLKGTASGRAEAPPPVDPAVVDRQWVSRTWTLKAALHTRRYWFFFAGVFLTSFACQQVLAHQVAYLRDAGFDALFAAAIVGVVGLSSVPAKITWGVLSDRIGREATYTIGVTLIVLALVTLLIIPVTGIVQLAFVYAFFIGAGYAVSATMPPVMTSDLFRGAAYGAIFGAVSMASNIGSGVGSWLAGFIFDHTGNYYLAFALAIVGVLIGVVCIWLAGPRRIRRVPGRTPRLPISALSPVPAAPLMVAAVPAAPAAGAPAAWSDWLDGRLAGESALSYQLSAWQAETADRELAEMLDIAAARSRDRAFRLRRSGATPAGAAGAALGVQPADSTTVRLDRLRALLLAWSEAVVAAPDETGAALVAQIRADTRDTLALVAGHRRRSAAPIRLVAGAPLQTAVGGQVYWKRLIPADLATIDVLWVCQ